QEAVDAGDDRAVDGGERLVLIGHDDVRHYITPFAVRAAMIEAVCGGQTVHPRSASVWVDSAPSSNSTPTRAPGQAMSTTSPSSVSWPWAGSGVPASANA